MTLGIGILGIPGALYILGAVAGSIFIVFWGMLNMYLALVLGQFTIEHPSTHTVPDAIFIATLQFGSSKRTALMVRYFFECVNILTWILATGATILALTVALNAISTHAACTAVFNVVAYVWISSIASIRKIHKLGWLAWIGFISIMTALLIAVIAVTVPDRPAAAPRTGPYELGFTASPSSGVSFAIAMASALAIFTTTANVSSKLDSLFRWTVADCFPSGQWIRAHHLRDAAAS